MPLANVHQVALVFSASGTSGECNVGVKVKPPPHPHHGIYGDFDKMPYPLGQFGCNVPGKPPHQKEGYIGSLKIAILGLQTPQPPPPSNPVGSPSLPHSGGSGALH